MKTDRRELLWEEVSNIGRVLFFSLLLLLTVTVVTWADTDVSVYQHLSESANQMGETTLFETLNSKAKNIDWKEATPLSFEGNLRLLKHANSGEITDKTAVYFVRSLEGKIYILARPEGDDAMYEGLKKMLESRMDFVIETKEITVDGSTYKFGRFVERPKQVLLDRAFKILIILMLFFVMVGMGLTLTGKDFAVVFSKPKGVILGEILQFGVMPLFAVGMGYLFGFRDQFPFIFVGMILITATPGGVTSNLMTHYAEGDVALSISMTSISTVLSIFFVPFLLNLYCSNIPDVKIPVNTIASTIVVLVLLPLFIGMGVRARWEGFAKRSMPFFSKLGVVALLFLILAGIVGNLDKFADTERYGVTFYVMVFSMTLSGMISGAVIPKLIGVNNFQARAISLETGLRNASLSMAIALLIQDAMGDFYSSLFWVSGCFGIMMFLAGFLSIKLYPKLLPINNG